MAHYTTDAGNMIEGTYRYNLYKNGQLILCEVVLPLCTNYVCKHGDDDDTYAEHGMTPITVRRLRLNKLRTVWY